MNSFQPHKCIITLATIGLLLIITTHSSPIRTKHIMWSNPHDARDPLLAMASDSQYLTYPSAVVESQQMLQPGQHSDFAYGYHIPGQQFVYQSQVSHLAQTPSAPVSTGQEEYYLMPSQYPQLGEVQHESAGCTDHQHQHPELQTVARQGAPESGPAEQSYGAEVIYLNQNGATQRAPDGQSAELANFGNMMMQNPGMPATILTEVPAKDMPQEFLDKLKADYGVKVVATRDRPGANLMINCEDRANQDVCTRTQLYGTLPGSVTPPPPVAPEYQRQPSAFSEESPRSPGPLSTVEQPAPENQYPRPELYTPREPEASYVPSAVSEESPVEGSEQNGSANPGQFGSREQAEQAQDDSRATSGHEEAEPQQGQYNSAQQPAERQQGQPESDPNAGFEVQAAPVSETNQPGSSGEHEAQQ